ncbi:hypothetical protein AAFF_G00274720 [Aldrovandia affinis]|uniref:Uncharacterized protein n=1 Tax=Aldrovandia affinis TaxID=143900 RepID=A0AAD7SRT6_9TELE|nr:hypothetical protein AAFF_G00274720 [Aldrovandia affinis]
MKLLTPSSPRQYRNSRPPDRIVRGAVAAQSRARLTAKSARLSATERARKRRLIGPVMDGLSPERNREI